MFERTKAKIRLHRICKALGVEPYPEMVRIDFISRSSREPYNGARRQVLT